MAVDDTRETGAGRRWRDLPGPVTIGEGRCAVRLELLAQGRDLVLVIGGGESHVGAVAVDSPADPLGPAAAELVTVPGHKEGALAVECARRLREAAGCTCVVVAGIHQDAATREEIAAIVENVRSACAVLVAALTGRGPEAGPLRP